MTKFGALAATTFSCAENACLLALVAFGFEPTEGFILENKKRLLS
jgi:hypothetical protein